MKDLKEKAGFVLGGSPANMVERTFCFSPIYILARMSIPGGEND